MQLQLRYPLQRRAALLAALLAVPVVDAGCGDDGPLGESESETSGEGTTTGSTGGSTGDDESTGDLTEGSLPPPLPPLDDAPLTTEQRLGATRLPLTEPIADPRIPLDLTFLLDEGYGDVTTLPGEPILDATFQLDPPPAPGPAPALLTRFVHLADAQLADDESPTRVVSLDSPDALTASFRPQEAHMCRVINAAVRTINAVHSHAPLDFVLLGGDNIDSAQSNELAWFTAILEGGPGQVHCDSGDDDDPVSGPDNDPKDPFTPTGLDVPWRWVSGNHDLLVQGNFQVSGLATVAVGEVADGGTRDWSEPGGPVVTGTVVADPARTLLSPAALLSAVAEAGDGHGIDDVVIERGRALYDFPIVGTTLRVVVVDSAAATGAASGVIHAADVEEYLRPTLDAAEANGESVIVTSHHCSSSLGDGGGFGGSVQEDALTPVEWQAFLGEEPAVILHLCAHSHRHRVLRIEPPGGQPYWEMTTASLIDLPQQMRVIEVRDEDNGFLSITGIALDYATDDDPLADAGRARAVTDFTSGWGWTGEGTIEDRNVRLWVPLP